MANSYFNPNANWNAGGWHPSSSTPTATTPTGMGTGNVSAVSRGTGFGSIGPDLSYADPATLARLQKGMEGLIYRGISQPGGGYRYGDTFQPGTQILQQHYIGQPPATDPNANRAAAAYYNYLGTLPTRNYGTLALQRLYQSTGTRPAPGATYNSMLQGISSQLPQQYQQYLPMNQGGWTGPYGI